MEGGWWMWRKGGCGERIDVEGECGGRVVDVKGGWWMWREGGGCEGRVVDVEEGWMWREDGCEGRVVYVEEGCMWREVTPVLLVLHSLPTHAILYTWATLSTSPTDISLSTGVTQSRKNSS